MSKATFKSQFGENLKRAAKEAGKTQEELSALLEKDYKIKLTKHSISNHYSGQSLPDLETVRAYCEILDVKADYLLFGGDDMKAGRPKQDNKDLDMCKAKTAILALADLMILTDFQYVKFADGKLHLLLSHPDEFDERADWFSYSQWERYIEQFQNMANIDSSMLRNSEKHSLIEKRIDEDLDTFKLWPYLSDKALVNYDIGTGRTPDDELPF